MNSIENIRIKNFIRGGDCIVNGRISERVGSLWRRFYPGSDDKIVERILESIVDAESDVLEIGAGSGEGLQNRFDLKGRVASYVGIDLDARVQTNPHLDSGLVADAADLPFSDGSFDVIFHVMCAEHFENPVGVTREMARVLKPGGIAVMQTPSRYYYPMLIAAITPHWVHEKMVARLGSGRQEADVFKTFYRINTRGAVAAIARESGLKVNSAYYSIPPGYLRFNPVAFLMGVAYERTVERLVPPLRGGLIALLQRPL